MGQAERKPDQVEERRSSVADLYLNGWQITRIARHLHVSRETIYQDIAAIRQEWVQNQTQSYGERVAKELEYTDHLAASIAHRVDTGDPNAIAVGLRIQERRAKYLALDAPTRVIVDDSRIQGLLEVAQKLGIAELPEVKEILAIEPE